MKYMNFPPGGKMGKRRDGMKTGTVLGPLEVSRTATGYENTRWVQLRTEQGVVTALDPIGAEAGQNVLYTDGPRAANYDLLTQPDALITAVIR